MLPQPKPSSPRRHSLRRFLCALAAGSAFCAAPDHDAVAQNIETEDSGDIDSAATKVIMANPNVVIAPSSVVVVDSEPMNRMDPDSKLRRGSIIYMISQGSAHRQASRMRTELVVHQDGTAIVPGDHRNRQSKYRLTRRELDELLNDLDVECEFYKILPDGKHFFELSGHSGNWDTAYKWVHVKDIERKHSIKCGYGWVSGTGDRMPSAVRFGKTCSRLYRVATLVRAGGTSNLPALANAANKGLSKVFPDLAPVTTKDMQSAEHFKHGPRIVYFSRKEGDIHLQISVQQHEDGTCDAMSVRLGDDRHDIETPPVVRGLSLAEFPVKHWTKSKLYERRETRQGESGRFYKPRDGFEYQDSGLNNLSLWINKKRNLFFVEHSDGARRKVYGPIPGTPADRLAPLPNAEEN